MKQRADKTVYTERIVTPDGELVNGKTIYRTQTEPEYVKLYIDCVFAIKGVKKNLNPIFIAFLGYMSYADANDMYGGQIIYVNKAMKSAIAAKTGLSLVSVNNAITEFVKKGLFKRVDIGTYQVNAEVVGKGEWKDIKNIRATFDYANREVLDVDVVTEESPEQNETDAAEEKNPYLPQESLFDEETA